jgi:Icc-related predicted phosphoesterase
VRILLASDLHYTLPQFDWVERVAADHDVVVLAGDHLDISSSVRPEVQAAAMLAHFRRLASVTRLVVCSGNHDLIGRDDHGEMASLWLQAARTYGVAVDGDSLELGDMLLTICPWWDGPMGREAVSEQLARDADRQPATWIWVYHWPPTGTRTAWTGQGFYGDDDLLGWIGQHQPDVVLAGHVHEPPFRTDGSWADRVGSTWVFNAGHSIGPVPPHVVLDLDERVARWWSFTGEEEQRLDDAPALVRPALS